MSFMSFIPLLLHLLLLLLPTHSLTTAPWLGRSIYFIVVDRFLNPSFNASLNVSQRDQCSGSDWCGGTLQGVTAKIPYIKSMGYDAVWITPVISQVDWRDTYNGTSYHGYWARDFFSIDERYGGEAALRGLSDALHEADMLLMLDVVANHVGPLHSLEDVAKLGEGLNDMTGVQFHTDPHPDADTPPPSTFEEYLLSPLNMLEAGANCWPNYPFGSGLDDCSYATTLDGWFGDLGDLNHENVAVASYLLDWIAWLRAEFNVDGFRLDTALYIPKPFLAEFQKAADVLIIGEVVTYNLTLSGSFQDGVLTGLLNFPITEQVKTTFSTRGSFVAFSSLLATQNTAALYSDVHMLSNFIDNHDGDRFLYNHTGDNVMVGNALTWSLLWHGIPSTYYGTEVEEVAGREDCRTSMWGTKGGWGNGVGGELGVMGEFVKSLHGVRREFGLAFGGKDAASYARVVAAHDDVMAFVRGDLLVIVNNRGEGGEPMNVCVDVGGGTGKAGKTARVVVGEATVTVDEDGLEVCVAGANTGPLVLAM